MSYKSKREQTETSKKTRSLMEVVKEKSRNEIA